MIIRSLLVKSCIIGRPADASAQNPAAAALNCGWDDESLSAGSNYPRKRGGLANAPEWKEKKKKSREQEKSYQSAAIANKKKDE